MGKLQTRCLDPYEIQEVHNNGTLTLTTIDGSDSTFRVNGHKVGLYRKPLTRESFGQHVHNDPTIQILGAGGDNPTTLST